VDSCEVGSKKTEDPKIAEDFLTSPDHIGLSLLLLLLLSYHYYYYYYYTQFLLLFVVTIMVVFQYISGHYSSIRSEDHNNFIP